eukprot:sb/3472950/
MLTNGPVFGEFVPNGHTPAVVGPHTPSPKSEPGEIVEDGVEEEEGEIEPDQPVEQEEKQEQQQEQQQPTMESILALMEKVDKDIVDTERVIKKVNTEISKKEKVGVLNVEMVPVNPRKTEITENVKLIQRIYSENKVNKYLVDKSCSCQLGFVAYFYS